MTTSEAMDEAYVIPPPAARDHPFGPAEYVNTRRRTERLIIVRTFLSLAEVLSRIPENVKKHNIRAIQDGFVRAEEEVFHGARDREIVKVSDRADRVMEKAYAAVPLDNRYFPTVWRACHMWLCDLTNRDIILLKPDGIFGLTFESMRASIDGAPRNVAEYKVVDNSAYKAALRLRDFYESNGLFLGI